MGAFKIPLQLRRHARRLPQLANLVCVVLLAVFSAVFAQALLNGFASERAANTTTINMVPEQALQPRDTTPYGLELARMHLMGTSGQAKTTANSDAPATKLNLTLNGVLALGAGQGYAIIQDRSRKDVLYHIDSEIISGVTLHSVYADYVLLSRAGRQEKLALSKAQDEHGDPTQAQPPPDFTDRDLQI